MKMHHLHKAEIAIMSMSFTLTKVEVEDVVQVKDMAVAVATRIKASNSSNSQMMRRDLIIMDGDSPEAGGEVAEITTRIMQRMIIENVGVVVGQVILNVTVHHEIRVVEDSKTIMRQPEEIQMI